MDEIWMRIVDNLMDRVSGPMKFRLLLQPVMAAAFAIIAGVKDAKTGKPPYFWSLFTHPETRTDLLKGGWKDISKVFILALILDSVYQVIVLRFIYLGEAIIVAILLAILPYLVLRGLITRLVHH